MTTICLKSNTLAADTQVVIDNIRSTCSKIRILNKDTVIACAGDVIDEAIAIDFFSKKNWQKLIPPSPTKKAFECILIYKNKPYYCLRKMYPIPIESDYFAIGSGWQLAISAMEMGASAVGAVKFASKLDINTNSVVETYVIKEKTGHKKSKAK